MGYRYVYFKWYITGDISMVVFCFFFVGLAAQLLFCGEHRRDSGRKRDVLVRVTFKF